MSKVNTIILNTLSLILLSCTHTSKDHNCKDFRNGVFHSTTANNGTSNKIFRNDTMQKEYNLTTGSICWARIKWVNDCEYELEYINEITTNKDSTSRHKKAHILTNRILKTVAGEINGTVYNYCVFESSMFSNSQKLRDTLWKHETTD
jgi:hypothetical protein